jgi:hypothetical protein
VLKQEADSLRKGAAGVHDKWKSDHNRWRARSKKEYEFAHYIDAMLSQEKMLDDSISMVAHSHLTQGLARLYDSVAQNLEMNVDEKQVFLDYLHGTFPPLASALEAHVYEVKDNNDKINEFVHKIASAPDPVSWVDDAISWAKMAWAKVQHFALDWELQYVPQIIKFNEAVDNYLGTAAKLQTASKVASSLAKRVL